MKQTDDRLEKIEKVTIDWETYKKALKRNYLSDEWYSRRQDRTFVLRLYPSFEAEMKAEYYESRQGTRYDNNWNEKPFHIRPEMILLEGTDKGQQPFRHVEWPNERNTRQHIPDEEVENADIDELVQEGREIFWNELKYYLPDTFCLGKCSHGLNKYEVKIEWTNLE